MNIPLSVRTRGGLLVGLVVAAVIGWELRTVLGMLVGFDVPMTPYLIAMIGLLSVLGVVLDVFRSSGEMPR
jgi:chromate transport protein ChrA